MEAASAFQPDPENTCLIFQFIWFVFHTPGFIIIIIIILMNICNLRTISIF